MSMNGVITTDDAYRLHVRSFSLEEKLILFFFLRSESRYGPGSFPFPDNTEKHGKSFPDWAGWLLQMVQYIPTGLNEEMPI